jgi:low affinity Fe/Cu permease
LTARAGGVALTPRTLLDFFFCYSLSMKAKHKTPKRPGQSLLERALESAARKVTAWTGSTSAFALSVSIVAIWVLTGPIFRYSDTWQLVINTGTTVVTFLMVFLIQRSQNKDSLALHLKLNEIVAAMKGASNRMIDVESLTERELHVLHAHYETLARMAKRDIDLLCSHSVEEAEHRHRRKVNEEHKEDAEAVAASSMKR